MSGTELRELRLTHGVPPQDVARELGMGIRPFLCCEADDRAASTPFARNYLNALQRAVDARRREEGR